MNEYIYLYSANKAIIATLGAEKRKKRKRKIITEY
jgi:hypothetical protein